MSDAEACAGIDAAKVELFLSGTFPDVQKFMKFTKGKNPRATLHALVQCLRIKPANPGGFCRDVIEKESPNFNESDAIRRHEDHKPARGDAKGVLGIIQGGKKEDEE